jgi:hypothetical protein
MELVFSAHAIKIRLHLLIWWWSWVYSQWRAPFFFIIIKKWHHFFVKFISVDWLASFSQMHLIEAIMGLNHEWLLSYQNISWPLPLLQWSNWLMEINAAPLTKLRSPDVL